MIKLQQVQDEVNKVVKGKEDVVKKVLAAMIGGGHVLMEDIPGVGKTTLAVTFAKALSLDCKRMQFTPDVLPSDITGFSMYDNKSGEFEFLKGPIFCNLFLADEINRTSPKTQSALLEVMEENHVTVDGATRDLPEPFTVIATENPYGASGTQMLPESQLDRFMICLSMGYPTPNDTILILKGEMDKEAKKVHSVLSREELLKIKEEVEQVFIHDSLYMYIANLIEQTRKNPVFSMGASPRGAIALLRMSKAIAVIEGRDYVTSQDIQSVLGDVLGHRVQLSTKAKMEGMTMQKAMNALLQAVRSPRM